MDLAEGARVLDIACGKAEPLIRIAERYHIQGTGVDISQFFVDAAKQAAEQRVFAPSQVELLVMDGKEFKPDKQFDLSICLGASWVYGGFPSTLNHLAQFTRPQGLIMVGEPYWRCEPSEEFLKATGESRDSFATHAGNVEAGINAGLIPIYSVASSQNDWDRYEWSRIRAGETYALRHPEDPDVPKLRARVKQVRDNYLKYGGREYFGWAVYLFVKP